MGFLSCIWALSLFSLTGIQFKHAWNGDSDGYDWGEHSAVQVTSSTDCTISDCEFSSVGAIGVVASHSSSITIEKNAFIDNGYHCSMSFGATNNKTRDIMFRNNYVDGCGAIRFWTPAGIWAKGFFNVSVINNEVTNIPSSAIQ